MRISDGQRPRPTVDHHRVLVVDREPTVVDRLRDGLGGDQWTVTGVADGRSALRVLEGVPPDAVVLDVELPDLDGLEVLREIRRERPTLPVLCLSGRAAVEDRIAAFARGSDDYVAKPFHSDEVVLRLRSLVRRSQARPDAGVDRITVGDLVLDEPAHEVTRGGESIFLTATEYALLRHLVRNANLVLSKSQLLRDVWDSDFDRDLNVVETYVGYLRRKIDVGRPPMIHTLRGVGYALRPAVCTPAARPPTSVA